MQQGSNLAELAMITRHPCAEAFQALPFQAAEAILPEQVLTYVAKRRESQQTLRWFTDGSVGNPTAPTPGLGAYAIVLHIAQDDNRRTAEAIQFTGSLENVPHLRVRGRLVFKVNQILRGANYKRLCVCGLLQAKHCILHVHSQSAIDLLQQALGVDDWTKLKSWEPCDIFIRI